MMDNNTSLMNKDIDIKEVLACMARAIVDNPDSVTVTEQQTDDELTLILNVAESDMGMIIGRHGKIARALRTVTKAVAKITDKKVSVEIK